MAVGRRRIVAGFLTVVLAALFATGCGGSPPDLGTVQPRSSDASFSGPWTVVMVEGTVLGASPQEAEMVEVDPDGRAMTVFFTGGNIHCYAVAGVDVERRDPELPRVTIRYGLRLGVMGCTAEGTFLALRQTLDPPFAP